MFLNLKEKERMNHRLAVDRGVLRRSKISFVDQSSAGTEGKQTKAHLAAAINRIIRERNLTQDQAAHSLHITQPKVSALANYRLGGFSVERLMQFLNLFGCVVEIVVHKPAPRRLAQTVVTATPRQDR